MTTEHIDAELARIGQRLAAYPDPFEHAGLYAAQQALVWAKQPDGFKSPFDTVTRAPPIPAENNEPIGD